MAGVRPAGGWDCQRAGSLHVSPPGLDSHTGRWVTGQRVQRESCWEGTWQKCPWTVLGDVVTKPQAGAETPPVTCEWQGSGRACGGGTVLQPFWEKFGTSRKVTVGGTSTDSESGGTFSKTVKIPEDLNFIPWLCKMIFKVPSHRCKCSRHQLSQ